MVLDPVPQEPQETKPMVQIYARKKALAGAASVLLTAAERLKTTQSEASRNKSDFHFELLRMRQNWRLKKAANSIIGDLSYKTAGSKFGQSGMFEVTKAEDEEEAPGSPGGSVTASGLGVGGTTPGGNSSGATATGKSSLRVSVPSELQGVAYIEVLCQKGKKRLICERKISIKLHVLLNFIVKS